MNHSYQTLSIRDEGDNVCVVTFNRPEQRNSINRALIVDLTSLLTALDQRPDIRVIVLAGQKGWWCTGMDFQEFTSGVEPDETHFNAYAALLRQLTMLPKIVVAQVDGRVLAGGLGLMSACDLVIASPASQFGLPEALWGLLPAMVMPFLMRRVGFQAAYRLTLTTTTIDVEQARAMALVDEVDADPAAAIRRLCRRLCRLHPTTVEQIKAYSNALAPISDAAIRTSVTTSLRSSSSVMVKSTSAAYISARTSAGPASGK